MKKSSKITANVPTFSFLGFGSFTDYKKLIELQAKQQCVTIKSDIETQKTKTKIKKYK